MIEQLFVQLQMFCQLPIGTPTATSVMLWVLKLGYACLTRCKPKGNDWVLILDESISLGSTKLLVIYGFQRHSLTFEQPLQLRDLTPLWIQAQTNWNGNKVNNILESLKKELGTIIYSVADWGAELKKGLRLASVIHVYDLTHKIAGILEHLYKDDPIFKEYCQDMSQMRTKLNLSTVAHILPPNQRAKSRFLNLDILAHWGMKVLDYLTNPISFTQQATREALLWVQSKETFIRELSVIQTVINQTEHLLKTKGLSNHTFAQCQEILKNLTEGKALQFKEQFEKYLKETLAQLPEQEIICCSSDILESAFGKYKNYLSQNPMAGFTPLALCLAAFTSNLTESEILQALENTTMRHIQQWANENIGKTLLQKRNKIFKKNGAKKIVHST